ncbi:MAG: hypothetical protein AAGH64_08205, partial [Planctomycetota bacterium]
MSEQSHPSTTMLIEHARSMLRAEEEYSTRLTQRGRLIVTAAPALVGALGIGLTIATSGGLPDWMSGDGDGGDRGPIFFVILIGGGLALLYLLSAICLVGFAAIKFIRHREDYHGSVMRGLEGWTFDKEGKSPDIADRDVFGAHRSPEEADDQDWKRSHQKHLFATGKSHPESVKDFKRLNEDTCHRVLGRLQATLYEVGDESVCDPGTHKRRSARKSNFIWSLRRWYWTQPSLFSVAPSYLADWYGVVARRHSRGFRSLGSDRSLIEREIDGLERERTTVVGWIEELLDQLKENDESIRYCDGATILPMVFRSAIRERAHHGGGRSDADLARGLIWIRERNILDRRIGSMNELLAAHKIAATEPPLKVAARGIFFRRRLCDHLLDAADT